MTRGVRQNRVRIIFLRLAEKMYFDHKNFGRVWNLRMPEVKWAIFHSSDQEKSVETLLYLSRTFLHLALSRSFRLTPSTFLGASRRRFHNSTIRA